MKIEKFFDKKERKDKYRARFQLGGKEFRPQADTRKKLNDIIDELRARQHRTKFELPVAQYVPTLKELFEIHEPKIPKEHQRKIFTRVSKLLLTLLPEDLKVTQLKQAHIQKYIDLRRREKGVQTGMPILDETIDKELASISSALTRAPLYFAELEDYQKPILPKAAKGPKRKRRKIVSKEHELDRLLLELRKPRIGRQTEFTERHRRRLADDLEFRFETGLRKKEVEHLKKNQYFAVDGALRDVIRWKTGTITEFYPLSHRAIEIVEARIKNNLSEFIFTPDGNAPPSDYRTLRTVCKKLEIPYGRYVEDGFVPHDLRRSFATNLIEHTDIESAREFLGHSNITQTGAYLKTNETRMRAAIKRREGIDQKRELVLIYKQVRRRKLNAKTFLEKLKKLADF